MRSVSRIFHMKSRGDFPVFDRAFSCRTASEDDWSALRSFLKEPYVPIMPISVTRDKCRVRGELLRYAHPVHPGKDPITPS